MPGLLEGRLKAVAMGYDGFVGSLPEPLRGLAARLTGTLAPGCGNPVLYYGAKEAYPLLRFPLWLEEKYVSDGLITGREGYGLSAASASLYGYLYIRIQDNVLDEPDLFDAAFLLLGNEFVREFFMTYTRIFPAGSPFWRYCREYWLATSNNTLWERLECGGKLREFTEADLARAGGKLEGVKVSMAAVCILAGREGDIPRFSSVLDRLNISSQLHNDAVSFVKDLRNEYFTGIIARAVGGGEANIGQSEIFRKASIKALTGSFIEDWLQSAADYNTSALALLGKKEMPGLAQYVKAKNAHLAKLREQITEIKTDMFKL